MSKRQVKSQHLKNLPAIKLYNIPMQSSRYFFFFFLQRSKQYHFVTNEMQYILLYEQTWSMLNQFSFPNTSFKISRPVSPWCLSFIFSFLIFFHNLNCSYFYPLSCLRLVSFFFLQPSAQSQRHYARCLPFQAKYHNYHLCLTCIILLNEAEVVGREKMFSQPNEYNLDYHICCSTILHFVKTMQISPL